MALHTACKRLSALLALLLLFAAPALHADTLWHWTYSSDVFDGSGTLTTTSTPGGNLINSFAGTWNGAVITGIVSPGTFGGNDNLLSSSQPQLTDNGVAFSVSGDIWNIFFDGITSESYLAYDNATSDDGLGVFSASTAPPTGSQVPEPSSFVLLGTAMMALTGFIWYRKQNPTSDLA